jgi:hypothetical protein
MMHVVETLFRIMQNSQSKDVCNAVNELLQYLPNDRELVEQSVDPGAFSNMLRDNKGYCLKYVIEILVWRLQAPTFRTKYNETNLIEELLAALEDAEKMAESELTLINLISFLQSPPLPENLVRSFLQRVADPNTGDDVKIAISDLLAEHCDESISLNLPDFLEGIDQALAHMNRQVWKHFSAFVWKLRPGRDFLLNMIRDRLTVNEFYRSVYGHYSGGTLQTMTKDQILELIAQIADVDGLDPLRDALINYPAEFPDAVTAIWGKIEASNDERVVQGLLSILKQLNDGHSDNADRIAMHIRGIINAVDRGIAKKPKWNFRPSSRVEKYRGLSNLGATCYMNASLQQFLQIPVIQWMLLQTPAPDKPGYQDLQKVLRQLVTSKDDHVNSHMFVRNWRGWNGDGTIEPGRQQHAAEFVRYLPEWLPAPIRNAFQIVLVARTEGISAPYETTQEEEIWMMPCAVTNMGSLEESLEDFFQVEELTGDNQILTDSQRIDAHRLQRIRTVPPIMIFNLKRIRYDFNTRRQKKITSKVAFPLEIDMEKYLEKAEPCVYQLSGAVLHSGGADSGHYRSILVIGGQFYLFNDRSVGTISKREMKRESFGGGISDYSSSAYLLFYVRKGGKIEGRDIYGTFALNLAEDFTKSMRGGSRHRCRLCSSRLRRSGSSWSGWPAPV